MLPVIETVSAVSLSQEEHFLPISDTGVWGAHLLDFNTLDLLLALLPPFAESGIWKGLFAIRALPVLQRFKGLEVTLFSMVPGLHFRIYKDKDEIVTESFNINKVHHEAVKHEFLRGMKHYENIWKKSTCNRTTYIHSLKIYQKGIQTILGLPEQSEKLQHIYKE